MDCLLVYWLRLLILSTRGSSGDGSSVCWLRGEFGKLCETSGCSADAGVASGRGLTGRVVVVSVACGICFWQKPVELLVLFLHLDWSLFWPLHFYTLVSMLNAPECFIVFLPLLASAAA